jgi:hypothetical protein
MRFCQASRIATGITMSREGEGRFAHGELIGALFGRQRLAARNFARELPSIGAGSVRATVDSIHRELQGTMKKLAAKGKVRLPAVSAPAAMVN